MKNYINKIVVLAFVMTVFMPFSTVLAVSLDDILAPATKDGGASRDGLVNILGVLALSEVLGKNFDDVKISKDPETSKPIVEFTKDHGSQVKKYSFVKRESIARDAKRYIGTPHIWGGITVKGFDAPGFTQYVLEKNRIIVGRSIREQFKEGIKVDASERQKGDLVFFNTDKKGASHVGVYIGDGEFVHASSIEGKVKVSSIDDEYFKTRYIGARRYIK